MKSSMAKIAGCFEKKPHFLRNLGYAVFEFKAQDLIAGAGLPGCSGGKKEGCRQQRE